ERRLVFARMNAVHRADIHARGVFGADARLGNHVSHTGLLCSGSGPARNSTTGKNSLYHAAARRDKQLRELYAGGGTFSTGGGMDTMRGEGRHMKIRTSSFLLVLMAAATALATPQASKTAASRDP